MQQYIVSSLHCSRIQITGPARSTFGVQGHNNKLLVSKIVECVEITNVSNAAAGGVLGCVQEGFSGLVRLVMSQVGSRPPSWHSASLHQMMPSIAHLPIIARSSLHPPSHHWPTALLSLFNLCGHLLLFRHPFSLDDTQDLVSKWPSTSESSMYGLCFSLYVGNTHCAKGPGLLECAFVCTLALV